MGADQNTDWRSIAASALEWWHDAGVDTLVEDAPRDWFAPIEPVVAPLAHATVQFPGQSIVQPVAPAIASAAMPLVLADFLNWRTGPQVPENSWSGAAIAASGPANAELMVLVDCPERDDADMLMGGPVGRLFDRMLAAIGQSRDTVHLAAVCAKRPTAGRIARDVEDRLGEIAQHHVALVAPKRLLLMGNAASRAILAMDLSSARGSLHPFNHKTGQTRTVVSFHPRFLIEKPAAKAEAWKDLQMVMGGMGE